MVVGSREIHLGSFLFKRSPECQSLLKELQVQVVNLFRHPGPQNQLRDLRLCPREFLSTKESMGDGGFPPASMSDLRPFEGEEGKERPLVLQVPQ